MKARSNKYLTFSLAALMVCSLSLFYFSRDNSRPKVNRDLFKLADPEKIDQVIFSGSQGKVELKYGGRKWSVNDRWDADPQMIKVLFAALAQVEVKRPVAASLKDSIRQFLEASGTRVELFEEGSSVLRFIAGGNPSKTEAWFLKEGEEQAYAMNIPGYRVYVAGILELNEGGWRNKRVFDFNWQNFKSLSVSYPMQQADGFEVEMRDRHFGIKGVLAIDTARLNSYLDDVSLLFASKFVDNKNPVADSLSTVSPIARIKIEDIGRGSYVLEIFSPIKSGEVYGRLGDQDFVTLPSGKTRELLRKRAFFIAR